MNKKRKSLGVGLFGAAFISAAFLCPTVTEAVPSLAEEQVLLQPNGTEIRGTQYGDEFFSYVAGEDGSVYEKKEDNYWYYKVESTNARSTGAKVGIDPKPANAVQKSEVLKQGLGVEERESFNQNLLRQSTKKWNEEQNLLVVLVEFNDVKLTTSEEEWQNKIFSTDGSTMRNFYLEQTNRRIDIKEARNTDYVKNGVLKVSLDQDHPFTGESNIGFNSFNFSAKMLDHIKNQVDFSIYDTNGNKAIEPNELHVMFIIAGYERSSGDYGKSVWGHKGWSSHLTTVNGLKFTDFTMFGEKMKDWQGEFSSTIGVICHEFGHDLGLPDLYNTDQVSGSGVGPISLMAQGSWGAINHYNGWYWEAERMGSTPVGLDAYSKIQLGVPFEELDATQLHERKMKAIAADTDPTIFKVQTQNPNEYFLIENRQITGFDRGMTKYTGEMPGGIGVYRVNTNYGKNHQNDQQLVTVLEADENIIGYSRYRQGEVFKSSPFYYKGKAIGGNQQQPNQVTKQTSPSTKLADGSYFDTEITVLSDRSEEIDVRIGLPIILQEIKLDPTELVFEEGQTKQIKATLIPEDATDKKLTWTSSDESIATVDENGKLSAHTVGKVTITAVNHDGTVSAICAVTVKERPTAIDDITIGKNMSVLVDEKKKADFSLTPENASTELLNWEIKDSTIATVDENGVVTGKKLGYTTLTVSTTDKKIIKELVVHVNSLYLGKTQAEAKEMTLKFNEKGQSETIYTDESGWLKFKIDTTAMYTVSGVAKGNFKPGQKVEMGFHNSEESRRLGLFGWDQRSTSYGVSWTESPVYYQSGDYIYIKTGIVSFKDGETQFYFSLKRDVTNSQPIYTKKVTINNKKNLTLLKDQTQTFTYTVDNYTTKPNQIELVSDDPAVAEVISDGEKQFKIIAKGPGKTTIRVKETSGSGKEDSLEVSVPGMLELGKTQDTAKEITLKFDEKGQSETIYTDASGWLKFKIDTTAMYTVSGVTKGNFKPGQKVEMGFHNSEESRRLGLFGWDQRTATSGVSWTESPVYYQSGDYIYIKTGIVSFKDGETQFYFSLKRDVTNPQPIYTKKVTINNKKDLMLLKDQTQTFTYTVDNYTTKPNQIELVSDDPTIAEVISDGEKQFKVVAKGPGKTTIRVKETSGSNKEDSIEVTVPGMLELGKTQAEAKEMTLKFDEKGQSETIYTDASGWLKFKIDTTAMYTVSGVTKGNFKPGQKVEMGFHNSEESRRLGLFGWDQRTATSGVSWTESPVYYQAGDYIYIKTGIVSFKDGETQFYFSLKRDVTNPQPIYTKKVTINNKKNLTLLKDQTQNFTYTVDNYTTKPNQIELISDDPTIAEVISDGEKQFKIIAKAPGKTTIRVKETSGSNKEDSLEITVPGMLELSQTKEGAPEIDLAFDQNGVSTTKIYADQAGWLKFKADETAMYMASGIVQGKFLMGQKVEVAFMNEQYENNKQAVFGWDQRTATSGVSWNTSKAYYQEGEYIYINVYTINITDGNAQFHFSLKKDATNPQPIYAKAVTISNKQNITLKPAGTKTFAYAVDTYCTKKIELISDDPTVAEVIADGSKQFKIVAKGPGKTTIRVKDVSGSNLEDSLEVTVNP